MTHDLETTSPLQYPVGTFSTSHEVETACTQLEHAGFSKTHLSTVIQDSDPNPTIKYSQVGRSAFGGAIAGSVFGALVGILLSITTQTLPDAANVGLTPSPLWVIGFCVVVGVAAGSAIAGLAGINIPSTQVNLDRASLTRVYIVMLNGTADEASRAKEVLGQPTIST